ncbi:MAG: hydantoinase B/oxoprolinase family protein [Alphaproteobacteria bacterium]|nr:hydantoinase B/oxoprolinase family protein [Alphaproteobacteria bacterium]
MTERIDPVTLGILWDRLISITNEIVETLVRTSFSSIVRESYDLAVVLFDARGRSLAQGTFCQPVFIGTGPQTMKHVLRYFPPESFGEGDVVITNDVYMGTGHLWDVNLVRPVFRKGRIVGYALTISHLPDIGGRGMSAVNQDIHDEGLQIPLLKLVKAGTLNRELVDLIRKNVRVSEQVIGDILANVTATEVGGRLLLDFMDEYRLEDLAPLADAIVSQSERAMREQIAAIPDGSYRNAIKIEGLDGPIDLACRIDVAGDRLHVDYAGTGPQIRAGINVPLCYTRAMTCFALKCLVLPNIPNNEGSVNPIELSAPDGSILNCRPPAASAARMLVGHFVVPMIFGALADALPHRVQGDPGMMNVLNVVGRRRDGEPFSTLFFSSGGFGALAGLDGMSATPAPANMMCMPAEAWEPMTGMRVIRRNFRIDSGGAGEFRGGLGQEIELRNDTGHPLTVMILGSRTEFPARGMRGAGNGMARVFRINGQPVHAKGRYELQVGDTLLLEDSGAGGYGNPRARAPERIASDLAEGLVSPEAALRDYGFDVRRGRAAAE